MARENYTTIRVKPTLLAAYYGMIPYWLANVYHTLVLNWPGAEPMLKQLDIHQVQRIAQMNFIFCIYALGVVAMLLMQKLIGALVCHLACIIGFLLGIGVVFTVVIPLRVIVSDYISGVIVLNCVIAIWAFTNFYVRLFSLWSRQTISDYRESQLNSKQ